MKTMNKYSIITVIIVFVVFLRNCLILVSSTYFWILIFNRVDSSDVSDYVELARLAGVRIPPNAVKYVENISFVKTSFCKTFNLNLEEAMVFIQ